MPSQIVFLCSTQFLIEDSVHCQVRRYPAWEDWYKVDACEDIACSVCSPLSQLCFVYVHEQNIQKPAPSQPCTRISFSIVLKKITAL